MSTHRNLVAMTILKKKSFISEIQVYLFLEKQFYKSPCEEECDLKKSGKNLYVLKYTYFLWCVNRAFVCFPSQRMWRWTWRASCSTAWTLMDWASHTRTQTTVTPAWTDPGYDPRGADASPGGQEEEEPKKNIPKERADWERTVELLYNRTLTFLIFVVLFEHYVRPEAKR